MPSLQALEEFKSSFGIIGNERATLAELELPQDDFPLPGADPADAFDLPLSLDPMDTFPAAGDSSSAGDSLENDIFGDLGDLLGGMDTSENTEIPAGQADIDFGAFIDAIPDDFTSQEPADSGLAGFDAPDSGTTDFEMPDFGATDAEPSGFDAPDSDATDFEMPDFGATDFEASDSGATDFDPSALLDGLADELEAEDTAAAEELTFDRAEDTVGTDFADMEGFADLDNGESINFPTEEDPAFDNMSFSPEEDSTFDGMSFSPEEDSTFDNTDLSAGGEPVFDAAEDADTGFADMDINDFPGFGGDEGIDFPAEGESVFDAEETTAPAMDFSDDDDSFGMGGEVSEFDNSAVLEEVSGDSFDNFKLDSNLTEDFGLGGDEGDSFGDGFGGLDDNFALPGVDSVFEGASAPAGGVSPAAAGREARLSTKKTEVDDVEEIRLTNDDVERFHATLSSYPLNLRIACQELIAEHAVDPTKMSRLIKMLINGASAKETAALAGKILDRTITIPKGFEKQTGEELEAEQSSFGYIFVHNFLPIFRLFMLIALVGVSLLYLGWRFVLNPIRADRIYQYGLEQIAAGNFARANERFWEAFRMHPRASWFFEYARAFTDARQFTLAEQKYLELLHFTASRNRRGIPDKEAVLEYAHMVSAVLGHHERADTILRHNLLDFSPMDREGLLALGDNAMAWGEHDPSRFEDAREAYATIIERYGRSDFMLERMLMFFIRTDNLGEVLALQSHFMASERRIISADALTEMGGYLLDKRLEEVRGVPNQFLDHIGGIRNILLRALRQNPMLPEAYYHLARYYDYFNNMHYERLTLEVGLRVFEAAPEGSPRRIRNHINALRRYGEILIRSREFFRAEEYLTRGINLYQSALSRRLITPAPEFGRLYALMGDMELFVREGNMQAALDYYRLAEQSGWAPPEMQYRMGAAYYHLGQWGSALERFLAAHREVPLNRRVLHALGNASFLRGNYFAAQGFYDQLLGMLYADRERLPPIWPSDDPRQMELVERIMVAQNNLGVTLESLTERTGDNSFRARAQGLYADSARAWDVLTRDPETLIRMRPSPDIFAPGINPAFLNIHHSLNPVPGNEPLFFRRIDMDMFEFSEWEILAPPGYRLSAGVGLAR